MTLFDEPGARAFLAEYWQRRPAFLETALADVPTAIDWRSLAADDTVESRRIQTTQRDGFELEHGPFDGARLIDDGTTPWTVLIQDADQHVAELRGLLDAFHFVPRWRLEDVMLSFATDGGSVGPHVDQYDVFLIQAEGERHWSVGSVAAVTTLDDASGLRLVAPFKPLLELVARPGDVLYLPPGVPHHGVARGSCVTYSVGFRAPTLGELGAALLEEIDPGPRYADAGMAPASNTGEIDADSIERAFALLRDGLALNPDVAARCLGRLVTEPKEWLYPAPPEQALGPEELAALCAAGAPRVACHQATRIAFSRAPALLFVNGEALALGKTTIDLAATLAGTRRLDAGLLRAARRCPAQLELLASLFDLGALYFCDEC